MVPFTLRQLEYFRAVAETGSATEAAKSCHVSQAALSSGIRHLETTLGTALFLRQKSRPLTLTSEGRQLYIEVASILDNLEGATSGLAQAPTSIAGPLRLGCFPGLAPVLLPKLAVDLGDQHPGIKLRFLEGSPKEMESDLRAGRCDAIISYRNHVSTEFDHHPIGSHSMGVAVHLDHPLAARNNVQTTDLRDYPWVLLDVEPISTLVPDMLRKAGIRSEPVISSRSIATVRSLVAQGVGFTITGVRHATNLSTEGLPLVIRNLNEGAEMRQIDVCVLRGTVINRRLNAAMVILKDIMKDVPSF